MPGTRMRQWVLLGYGLGWMTVLAASLATVNGFSAATSAPESRDAAADPADHKFDPARVMGAKACIRCHRSEYVAWLKTVHAGSDRQLKTAAAAKYAKEMGIANGDILKNSICVACHATPQKSEAGTVAAAGGVSCESCHGPSGGDPGWLNRHAVYGLEGTRREQESAAHRSARIAYCRKQGKIGPEDLYSLAKRCLQCHLIGNEKLVKAGHKLSNVSFDFGSWANGEVRHNFHLDQSKNADASTLWMNPVGGAKRTAEERRRQMYVVGILAGLETSLRIRADAKDAGFVGQAAGLIGPVQGQLAAINAVAGTPETKQVFDMLTPMLGRLFTPQAGDGKYYNEQADKVARAGKDFLAKRDMSKLKALDSMIPQPHYPASAKKKP
jgi:Cytochrome c554 and c-prime